uniref:mucin-19-like isoform X6 n=1 Tax=Vespula vulgaris TaxID=7454 RepID=UPI00223AF18D|nr:mucin-19-like isoform X6 [Vespula vulgaris]
MRPILFILICLTNTAFSYYSKKTRFDRSINDKLDESINKEWAFTDDQTFFTAYKDRKENACYLERLKKDQIEHHQDVSIRYREKQNSKVLYVPNETLTKLEAWREAGGRIVDFCRGRNIYLLQETKPITGNDLDPFLNEIPIDENDISSKRVADIVLIPLLSRAKREIQLENRKRLNEEFEKIRIRRQTSQFRGRFRGQTQSQYLNLGNDGQTEGKAEAEATQQSSRAVVAGNHGMGQAQSMSSSGSGCEECPGYQPDYALHVDPGKLQIQELPREGQYVTGPGAVGTPGRMVDYRGSMVSGTGPTGGVEQYPEAIVPGSTVPKTTVPDWQTYPGGIQPGTGTYPTGPIGPGSVTPGQYPGGVVSGGAYPGALVPGSVPIYPGGVIPGTPGTPGGSRPYPAGTVPGTGVMYPGGVPSGTVQTGGDVAYPGGTVIGTKVIDGTGVYPGGTAPGSIPTGGGVTYPGGPVTGTTTTGGTGVYPESPAPGRVPTGGGVAYPGGPVTGGTGVYPGGTAPGTVPTGGGVAYPGRPVTGTTTTGGTGVYPGSTAPRTGGAIPETITTGGGTYPGTIRGTVIPGGVPPEALRQPGERYPAETSIPGVSYPTGTGTGGTVTYPGGVPSGVGITGVGGPGVPIVGGSGMYPAGIPGTVVTESPAYPGRVVTTDGRGVSGAGILPNIVTAAKTDVGTSISYPGISHGIPGVSGTGIITPQGGVAQPDMTRFITPGTVYPGAPLPGSGMTITGGAYPGSSVFLPGGVGTYPGGVIPGTGSTGTGGVQYPPSGVLSPGQITNIPAGVPGISQYPTINQYYPGGIGGQRIPGQYPGGTVEASQFYQKPKDISLTSAEDDGADTQASSSVKQVDSGTEASASAQGKYGQGTAQSQVSGIYSGSASFSAQAGTSDINRSAQAEISGGKDGAVSNAEGVGGRGKSQAQVQLNSDSGATSTGAQSSGWNHGTTSQVQASSKGGMADAQANGEGSTSSQAQIGFQPYLKNDNKVEKHSLPFRGGGTASAQSGTHRGQSQSQLQGSFQYGITYTGAAQAGSGSGAAASRKPFNFNLTNPEIYRSYKPSNIPSIFKNDATEVTNVPSDADFSRIQAQRGLQTSSSSRQTVVSGVSKEKVETSINKKEQSMDNKHAAAEPVYGEEEYEDQYEDEDYDSPVGQNPPPNLETFSSNKKLEDQHQSQMIQIGNANRYDVRVTQDSNIAQAGDKLQPGQSLPGYTIPPGFRGRVLSIAGDDTVAKGDGKAQSQTVALIPAQPNTTLENKSLVSETRSLHNNYPRFTGTPTSKNNGDHLNAPTRSSSNSFLTRDLDKSIRPSYYTVTNSVAGKIDDNKSSQKKYEHRYYTKSSTCGYFTFSCNIVYGSNGRTKICKPKVPTYPDGTPMKC